MSGLFKKNFNTVVMDGSDPRVLRTILSIMEMMVGVDATKCRWLDYNHPTRVVIETRTTDDMYKTIEEVLEETYPALCTFNAVV